MPFIVGLLVLLFLFGWFDEKLTQWGITWASLGWAACGIVVLGIALGLWKAKKQRQQARQLLLHEAPSDQPGPRFQIEFNSGLRRQPPSHDGTYRTARYDEGAPLPGANLDTGDLGFDPGEVVLSRQVSMPLLLRYQDKSGARTERTVTIQVLGGRRTRGRGTYLTSLVGYCHLRKSVRRFKATGILEAYDTRSGEAVTNLGGFLAGHPDRLIGDPPPPPSRSKGSIPEHTT